MKVGLNGLSQGGLLCAALLSALLAGPAAGDEVKGFIVSHDSAPHYGGPLGGEGNTAEVLATRSQTGGVFGVWRSNIEPEFGPPLHIHKEEDEFFYVLSGEFALQLGDCVQRVQAGAFAFIPKNAPHTYRKTAAGPGVLLGVVSPGGFESFFEQLPGADDAKVGALAADHAMDSVGPPIDLGTLGEKAAGC